MAHPENCRQLLDSLSDYVDGDLEDALCAEIERHLAGCNNCRVVVDTLKKTVYLVQETKDDPELPDDVRRRLFHALNLDEFIQENR
jgi:anti-sigma factor RsiW